MKILILILFTVSMVPGAYAKNCKRVRLNVKNLFKKSNKKRKVEIKNIAYHISGDNALKWRYENVKDKKVDYNKTGTWTENLEGAGNKKLDGISVGYKYKYHDSATYSTLRWSKDLLSGTKKCKSDVTTYSVSLK